jgi:hypothetical protein
MAASRLRARRPAINVLAAAVLSLGLLACTASGPASSGESSPSVRPGSTLPPKPLVPASDLPTTGEVPEPVMTAVLADLATRTGGDTSQAQVVTAEAVEWPNGALGCPEPGMMYTQVIVPGYHVVLSLDGREYDYRVAGEGDVIRLCENPGPLGA